MSMNPKKALKRIVIRKTVDETFKAINNHPLLKPGEDVYLDIFNSGIVVNIKKTAQKYFPRIEKTLREIIEKELKKL